MDQKLRNEMALKKLGSHCTGALAKLMLCLCRDSMEREEHLSQDVVRFIHNDSLFDCLRVVNSTAFLKTIMEYQRFANTLKCKFFEIVEALRSFKPTAQDLIEKCGSWLTTQN